MSEANPRDAGSAARIQSDLTEFARLLREGERLDPETQQTLANLLEELSAELHPEALPTEQTIHLAELTGRLAEAVHQQQEARMQESRQALEEAALKAESQAAATGIVGRLMDVLSGIGI